MLSPFLFISTSYISLWLNTRLFPGSVCDNPSRHYTCKYLHPITIPSCVCEYNMPFLGVYIYLLFNYLWDTISPCSIRTCSAWKIWLFICVFCTPSLRYPCISCLIICWCTCHTCLVGKQGCLHSVHDHLPTYDCPLITSLHTYLSEQCMYMY